MRNRMLLCMVVGLAWGCGTASADYRVEGSVGYAESDGDALDSETTSASGALYLGVVTTDQVPLAEAGFLSRQSVVRYLYSKDETEFDSAVGLVLGPGLVPEVVQSTTQTTGVDRHAGEFVYISQANGWFGLLRIATSSGDAAGDSNLDGTLARLGVGRYVTPTSVVQVFFERSQQDVDSSFRVECDGQFFCFDLAVDNRLDTEIDSIGVLARHVGVWSGYHFALQGLIQRSDSDVNITTITQFDSELLGSQVQSTGSKFSSDAWLASVDFTWYLNPKLGLSAGFDFQEVESNNSSTYRLGVGWFVHSNIELRAQVSRTDPDGSRGEIDQFSFGLTGRF